MSCAANASVASFDLFDTLLVRVFGCPTDLFAAMADRIALTHPDFDRGKFVQMRVEAERCARQTAAGQGQSEITLKQIYAELAAMSDGGGPKLECAMALECELEIASVRPDQQIKAAFDELVARGTRVVIVSDMYLPLACIEEMLAGAAINGHARIYLSNDCRRSKADGSVWEHLKTDLGLSPQDVVAHIGDNAEADGRVAARFGVTPFLLTPPHRRAPACAYPAAGHWFNDSCRALLQQSLVLHRDNPRIDPFWLAVAHLVVLPVTLGFAAYVRDIAEQDGGRRVFFLARDGLIFQKAYEAAWRRPQDPPSRYLWASRRCLNFAMIDAIDEEALAFLLSGYSVLPVGDFLRRVDLDPTDPEVATVVQHHFPAATHSVETRSDRDALRAMMIELGPIILRRASAERAPLLAHLKSASLFAGPGVVVDLGWHGSLQRSLMLLGQRKTGALPDLVGAYLGTFEKRVRLVAGQPMRATGWLFDADEPRAASAVIRNSVEVVELLMSAPESGIRCLRANNGVIEPVRIVEPEESGRIEVAAVLHDAIETACRALRPYIESVPRSVLRETALQNLKALLEKPSAIDAEKFRSVLHAEGFGAARYRPLVAEISGTRNRRGIADAYGRSFWQAGFLAGLSPGERLALEATLRFRRLRASLRHGA
ncbi:MAG: hypothetical protein JO001_27855 [Alphaproteobacteria bacterium]|nr:hypothetical protein [Alphaproteobacteria bacterium]